MFSFYGGGSFSSVSSRMGEGSVRGKRPLKRNIALSGITLARRGETWGDLGRCGEICGDMARRGEIWGDLGRCGEICGDMARRGEIWGDVGRCGEICGDMARRGETWRDVGRCGEMWGDVVRSAEMWGDRPAGEHLGERDRQRLELELEVPRLEDPRSPEITRDRPRSPEIARDSCSGLRSARHL